MRDTPRRAERAALYRKAAASIEKMVRGEQEYKSPYSCDHLGHAMGVLPYGSKTWTEARRSAFTSERFAYAAMMAPEPDSGDYWGIDNADPESVGHRILSLCFMAAMVEAGDA